MDVYDWNVPCLCEICQWPIETLSQFNIFRGKWAISPEANTPSHAFMYYAMKQRNVQLGDQHVCDLPPSHMIMLQIFGVVFFATAKRSVIVKALLSKPLEQNSIHQPTLSTITSPLLDSGTPLPFKKSVDGITPDKDKQDTPSISRSFHNNLTKVLRARVQSDTKCGRFVCVMFYSGQAWSVDFHTRRIWK